MGCIKRVDVMKECLVIMPVVLLDEDASDEVMKSCNEMMGAMMVMAEGLAGGCVYPNIIDDSLPKSLK